MPMDDLRCKNCGGKLIPTQDNKAVCENCETVFMQRVQPKQEIQSSEEIEKMEDYFYLVINNKMKENPVVTGQYRAKLTQLKPNSPFLLFQPGHGPLAPFENIYVQIETQKEFCYCLNNWLTTFYLIVKAAKKMIEQKFNSLASSSSGIASIIFSKKQKAHILKEVEQSYYKTNEILTVLEGVKDSPFIKEQEIQDLLVLMFNYLLRDTADERKIYAEYIMPAFQGVYNLLTNETLKKHPEISLKGLQTRDLNADSTEDENNQSKELNENETKNEDYDENDNLDGKDKEIARLKQQLAQAKSQNGADSSRQKTRLKNKPKIIFSICAVIALLIAFASGLFGIVLGVAGVLIVVYIILRKTCSETYFDQSPPPKVGVVIGKILLAMYMLSLTILALVSFTTAIYGWSDVDVYSDSALIASIASFAVLSLIILINIIVRKKKGKRIINLVIVGVITFVLTIISSICLPIYNSQVYSEGEYKGDASLITFEIGNNVRNIGYEAFADCINLQTVTIEANSKLETINEAAFRNCYSLESITLPNTLKRISYYAFQNCSNLKNVYFEGTIEQWAQIYFEDLQSNPLHNGANLYINNQKVDYLEIPDSVLYINSYAFYGCKSLEVVLFPNPIYLGSDIFYNCQNLEIVLLCENWNSYYDSYYLGVSYYVVYTYSETEPNYSGNYWHYVDGIPTIWD